MQHIGRKSSLLIALTGLLLLLAACQTAGTPAIEAEPEAPVIDLAPLDNAEAEVEAETVETEPDNNTASVDTGDAVLNDGSAFNDVISTDPPITKDQNTDILEGDDRSPRLAQTTATWDTNWGLRTVETESFLSGGPPRDGIPSIDDPIFISQTDADEWLADNEPVISIEINGDARAYPIQVVTWHEIVNDVVGGTPVVVTFCPLCNSALTFDRRVDGELLEFGVSGLLRNSDLIMYDRTTETLWQQFTGEALVGDLVPKRLTFVSTQMISYADFKAAYPGGVVLSRQTGHSRPYGQNPYAGYDTYDNGLSANGNLALFSGPEDGRLDAISRVVTVSLDEQGVDIAYPLGILSEEGAINDEQAGVPLVVFHQFGTASALGAATIAEAEDVGATGVFSPIVNGERLTFSQVEGGFVDDQTGSTWNIVGQAIDGELAGTQLDRIVNGDHFWFSWAAFKPDTIIYGAS